MKYTIMHDNGYRYYVYRFTGCINYFETLQEALEFQAEMGGEIGEVF